MKTITLSQTEVRIVKFVGRERYTYNRRIGAKATLYGGEKLKVDQAIIADQNAYGGEFAFCKLFGLMPDMDTTRFPDYDAQLPNGQTVDVKTASQPGHRLLVKPLDHEVDLYALMIGTLPTYTFMGLARAEYVRKPEKMDNRLHHPAYAVAQAELFMPLMVGVG